MEGVVLHGTGRQAILKGYTSGGKTGSAQIYDLRAHVYVHSYNASFLGFAPVANPQIVIAVTVNGTTGGNAGFGGPVAAPVFRQVATSALRMLDVPKDLPDGLAVLARRPVDENDLAIAGLGKPPAELSQRSVSPSLRRRFRRTSRRWLGSRRTGGHFSPLLRRSRESPTFAE
jgi:membrane peptidoglycan carboxypeptidase